MTPPLLQPSSFAKRHAVLLNAAMCSPECPKLAMLEEDRKGSVFGRESGERCLPQRTALFNQPQALSRTTAGGMLLPPHVTNTIPYSHLPVHLSHFKAASPPLLLTTFPPFNKLYSREGGKPKHHVVLWVQSLPWNSARARVAAITGFGKEVCRVTTLPAQVNCKAGMATRDMSMNNSAICFCKDIGGSGDHCG
jgi:hypothetical protein